jgi:hypothetical protein
MFDKLRMNLAAKRMQRQKDYAAADKHIRKNETYAERVILWPFRMIGRCLRWIWDTTCAILSWIWDGIVWLLKLIWKWLCSINLVGLINLALLIAIIVLCSMLIINILNCNKKPVVINTSANNVKIETKSNIDNRVSTKKIVNENKKTRLANELPIERRDGNLVTTINAVPTNPSNDPTLRPQGDKKIYGDVIIESRGDAIMLQNGTYIRGNLYLQNMHKYVLPCGVRIDGNLFLRDLNLLQFCGEFTVNGNIYVSPRSSFGPIPRNARVRGQIIL